MVMAKKDERHTRLQRGKDGAPDYPVKLERR
jgi:hypothetical protein